MKLDANMLRYLTREDFRVLTAVEMGQRNHELVPAPLIASISRLRHGGSFKVLRTLLRHKLLHHDSSRYDGYRLTTLGYDFLALRALSSRGTVSGVGRQIGVGKESDVYEVVDETGRLMVVKFHRLGRTSFRAVKSKRDYLRHRRNYSWLYLSRLAAAKEFAFMQALSERGFPVPEAIDQNRHCVVMSVVEGYPLSGLHRLGTPRVVFCAIVENMRLLARAGLVHCDLNEFNIIVSEDEKITIIDFPQMVSIKHTNAPRLFRRDLDCILKFFERKFDFTPTREDLCWGAEGAGGNAADGGAAAGSAAGGAGLGPEEGGASFRAAVAGMTGREADLLDLPLRASGFKGKLEEVDFDGECGDDDDGLEMEAFVSEALLEGADEADQAEASDGEASLSPLPSDGEEEEGEEGEEGDEGEEGEEGEEEAPTDITEGVEAVCLASGGEGQASGGGLEGILAFAQDVLGGADAGEERIGGYGSEAGSAVSHGRGRRHGSHGGGRRRGNKGQGRKGNANKERSGRRNVNY